MRFIALFLVSILTLTNAQAYSGTEAGYTISLITDSTTSGYLRTEAGYTISLIADSTTSGYLRTEGYSDLGLNLYPRGVGGGYSEGGYRLYLVPGQAFISYLCGITANDPPCVVPGGNNLPAAANDTYSTDEDITLNIAAPGVLGNDTDVDGDPLTAVLITGTSNGILTLNANGSFTYTPNPNFNGADSFTYKANDGTLDSNIATVSITVNSVNDAPVASSDAYSVDEDNILNIAAPGVLGNDGDVDSNALTAVVVTSPSNGDLTLNSNGSFTYMPNANFNGADSFTYKANDGTLDSNIATVSITVNSVNDAPTVEAGLDKSADEGSSVSFSGTFTDPDPSDTHTISWDFGDGTTSSGTLTPTHTYTDNRVYTVTFTVTDNDGGAGTDSLAVTITNIVPVVGTITAPIDPQPTGTSITASAPFTDPGTSDTHSAVWNWGDGTISAGAVTETSGSGSVTGSHAYTAVGIYTVTLTVTDDDSGTGYAVYDYVVVYDPGSGFVTGGGWINSPQGAYTLDPSLTGKANFGFVSKYQKGASVPTGTTEFQFKAANFNFHSTSYDWLVIAGARAQFKGTGTINGAGNYVFMLTGIDGQVNGGGGSDKFRIKIWDMSTGNTIYDNQMGATDTIDPTTSIAGGSIVIHK